MKRPSARVILDLTSRYNRHTYSYAIPPDFGDAVKPGATVVVPVRNDRRLGYVIGLTDDDPVDNLKPILNVVHGAPVIRPEQLELTEWIADYYLAGPNETLKLVLPSGLRHHLTEWVEHKTQGGAEPGTGRAEPGLTWLIEQGGRAKKKEFEKAVGRGASARLIAGGAIGVSFTLEGPADKPKMVEFAAAIPGTGVAPTGHKQQALLAVLKETSPVPVRELLETAQAGRATLKSLVSKGLVELFSTAEEREYDTSFTNTPVKKIVLNADQETALRQITEAIQAHTHKSFLLEGVTGSGKTEVYIRAAAECLAHERAAIFLVPEIALLPQLAERLAQRFGNQVAVIHSALRPGQRTDALRAVAEGRKRIIVGARSALFAPAGKLGLIVIDEEHETSYKQNSVPRYDARAAAAKLAQAHGAVVVSGSATPSLEARLRCGTDGHLRLEQRAAGLHFPTVEVVDMRREVGSGNYGIFSDYLAQRLTATLDAGHKAILLMNRRGFSNCALCRHCGFVPQCDHCSISMTYHQSDNLLRCHHCAAARPVPDSCPKCSKQEWRYAGVGTQRVETELLEGLPDAEVIRMDADTTGGHRSHHDQLLRFHQAKRAVLLGTQMVAKGLDFPEVALVGIINADTALNLPDFRAAERTAQLLVQVSGRSGRGAIPGEVIVQTFSPENYAIRAATEGYGGFYGTELEYRRELGYPPFSSMINVIFSGRDRRLVAARAEDISNRLKADLADVARFLGPAPAPIERIKGFWRRHLVVTTDQPEKVKAGLREDEVLRKGVANLRIIIDVDPVWLL